MYGNRKVEFNLPLRNLMSSSIFITSVNGVVVKGGDQKGRGRVILVYA